MKLNDEPIVLTLDAGGTNYVFSAIQGFKEIIKPIACPSYPDSLEDSLRSMVAGFKKVKACLNRSPDAISFAFPGPADYENGIIGDLPNFPSFRGGVALGPYLEEIFGIPVYINNDGNLFALGEAIAGALPDINKEVLLSGGIKPYKNLLGVTIGTGFGGGVVIDGRLLTGDNGCGGDLWLSANKFDNSLLAEEGVSIRAVKMNYKNLSGDMTELTPKDVFDIAEGVREGDKKAAIKSFEMIGEVAGFSIAESLNIVDGLVVIGGGISKANKYILPSLVKEMRRNRKNIKGEVFPRLQMHVFNLDDEKEKAQFMKNESEVIKLPHSDKTVIYQSEKKIGVITSRVGTSNAIALGAYSFAVYKLNI